MANEADSLAKASASIHSVPHPQFPEDGLTEWGKTTGALVHFSRPGHFTLVQEQTVTLQKKTVQPQLKLRSRSAAEQLRRETTEAEAKTPTRSPGTEGKF